MKYCALVLLAAILSVAIAKDHGRTTAYIGAKAVRSRTARAVTAESTADVMARNILEWIQGLYRQGARRPRQQSDNAYLPPFSTQRPPEKPRPFQPATTAQTSYPSPNINEVTNYQRPSSSYTPPGNGYSSNRPFPPFSTSNGPSPSFPTSAAPKPFSPSVGYPTSTTYLPPSDYPRPSPPTGVVAPGQPSEFPPNYGYPSSDTRPKPGFPTPPAGGTSETGYPTPGSSSTPGGSIVPGDSPAPGSLPGPGLVSGRTTTPPPAPIPTSIPGGDEQPDISDAAANNGVETNISPEDDDLKHPPHIHKIDVECSKTMMTINIEFNRVFDGVIYSKGFFMTPACRYVEENSGKKDYSFTVSLDSCGTQFINDFEGEAGQAYLENVLVLQNELGIQEIWDTVRSVRCLWEGNINKALTVTLSVDMLNQEIVTFSGDTASAKLDIQVGRGPFAPAANGLVKIGETMTLVVSVEGDPGFDLYVRDCIARDETSTNVVQLTDERGCILKPKFFGSFQKTRDTGNTGASIIAYAFFQAFKFPDVMDLFIECNVELCKTDCEACPEENQQIEPGRRRRSVIYSPPSNSSRTLVSNGVRVARGFRVVMPEDLSPATTQALEDITEAFVKNIESSGNVCLCDGGFYVAFSLMFVALVLSTISAAVLYVKLHRIHVTKTIDLSKGS